MTNGWFLPLVQIPKVKVFLLDRRLFSDVAHPLNWLTLFGDLGEDTSKDKPRGSPVWVAGAYAANTGVAGLIEI